MTRAEIRSAGVGKPASVRLTDNGARAAARNGKEGFAAEHSHSDWSAATVLRRRSLGPILTIDQQTLDIRGATGDRCATANPLSLSGHALA